MSLDRSEAAPQYSPDGAIFLPERQSPAYKRAQQEANEARQTADNMQRLAGEYNDLAKAWGVRADERQAVADHIATRTVGSGALNAVLPTVE